jgi:hypothetical protein
MTIETLIAGKIKKIDSTLDLQGSDRKLFKFACQDFANYMKFKYKSANNLPFEEKVEKFSKKELSELESFLSIWTAAWMKKWQERVKLLVGNQRKTEHNDLQKTLEEAQPAWETLDCKEELMDIVQSTLINNGEICGTQILAEHVLKMELAKDDLKFDNGKTVEFLNNVLRRARVISQTSGPLMFIEINRAYYASVVNQSLTQKIDS